MESRPTIKSPGRIEFDRKKQVAYITYSLGKVGNKYERVYHTLHDVRTKAEAREKAEEWRRAYNDGTAYKGRTVAEYAASWLQEREELAQVKNSTLGRDRRDVRKICEVLGGKDLRSITTEDVRKLQLTMAKEGYAPSVTAKSHACLKRILKRAWKDGLIDDNPAQDVSAPRVPKTTRKPLSPEEAARFMRLMLAEKKSGHIAACLIAIATGCRRGEALALTWPDYKGRVLFFGVQYTKEDGVHELKNDAEPRKVSIGESVGQWLDEWRDEQHELLGVDAEYICSDQQGQKIRPDMLRSWWTRWCVHHGFAVWRDDEGHVLHYDESGWPVDGNGRKYSRGHPKPRMHYDGLKFHELRHTQATILIAAGVDVKTVQARGGWSSPRVPMEIYAHVVKEKDSMAADVFEKTVLGG